MNYLSAAFFIGFAVLTTAHDLEVGVCYKKIHRNFLNRINNVVFFLFRFQISLRQTHVHIQTTGQFWWIHHDFGLIIVM